VEDAQESGFDPSPDEPIFVDFVQKDLHTVMHYIQLREGGGQYGSGYSGGGDWSYNPELRELGLKVGRDGKLHEVGPDLRDPGDPDEGPVVGWDELHRRQFGR
jgi:hypothetical protein